LYYRYLPVPLLHNQKIRSWGAWQQKIQTEKIAYLTGAMGLTPAEAQKFWPLYNKMESERKQSFDTVMKAYRNLDQAVKAGKSDKEISVLLNRYVVATKNSRSVEAKYTPLFEKIIPVEKVARLYIGEESFRRQQIHKFNKD
jgi:hypothetical protein